MSENGKYSCLVCGCPTNICRASPLRPYSCGKCIDCIKARRIPYKELLLILRQDGSKCYKDSVELFGQWWASGTPPSPKESGIEYFNKYAVPTLEFFGKTPEEAWSDAFALTEEDLQCYW